MLSKQVSDGCLYHQQYCQSCGFYIYSVRQAILERHTFGSIILYTKDELLTWKDTQGLNLVKSEEKLKSYLAVIYRWGTLLTT